MVQMIIVGLTPVYRRGNDSRAEPVSVTEGSKRSLETGKAHKVGAETEARALARREANARGKQIKKRERHRRDNRHREDLLDIELLLGNDERRKGDREALKEVLDRACYELGNSEAVHTYNLGPENLLILRFPLRLDYELKPGTLQ